MRNPIISRLLITYSDDFRQQDALHLGRENNIAQFERFQAGTVYG